MICLTKPDKFQKLSLIEERRLIRRAKRGSQKDIEELVLRHVGFIAFRIYKKAFPVYIERFGEDILSEATFILYDLRLIIFDIEIRMGILSRFDFPLMFGKESMGLFWML
jgi:hypothetical protein